MCQKYNHTSVCSFNAWVSKPSLSADLVVAQDDLYMTPGSPSEKSFTSLSLSGQRIIDRHLLAVVHQLHLVYEGITVQPSHAISLIVVNGIRTFPCHHTSGQLLATR